ncbi:hypothetical protein TNCV_1944611 [Trichonephila clavipes]|nr:hypothetical protein TNCV_1944611 [Trichonephila clavipes]
MWIIFQGNRQSCWTKPNNCNADMSPLDTGGYDGLTRTITSTSVHYFIRVVCPQDVHCLVYHGRRDTDISATNGAMKEGFRQLNGMKLYLLTNHASVSNNTMVGFESGDTVERGC